MPISGWRPASPVRSGSETEGITLEEHDKTDSLHQKLGPPSTATELGTAQGQVHRVWWRKEAASRAHGHPEGPRLEQPRGAGQWAGGRGATPRTGGPGGTGSRALPPGQSPRSASRAKAPHDPLQADSGTQARPKSLAQMSSLTTGPQAPGTRRTGLSAQASVQRELWGGPAVSEPRDAPPWPTPARGCCA